MCEFSMHEFSVGVLVRTIRWITLLAIVCLLVYAIYRHVHHPALHPIALHVANRPEPAQSDPAQTFPERAPSQVAILLTKPDQGPESAVRCLQEMGIPFFVTRDLRTALRHKLLVMHPEVDGTTFDAAQAKTITDFVTQGGVVFAQDVLWGGFKPLFGFDDVTPLRTRHKIVFDAAALDMTKSATADPVLRYLNRPAEKEVPLGSPAIAEVIWTNGYKAAAGTKILARFDDGSSAILRHDVGRGHAYLIGVALNDVVLRNQQNRDYEAQRIYVNGFEPGTDVWLLLL